MCREPSAQASSEDAMAAPNAITVADGIAAQLSGLLNELVNRYPISKVTGVNLADAPASGRAVRLYIFQCDSDDLTLVSSFRRWWVTDTEGFRWVEKWPLTKQLIQSAEFGVDFPYVRFATD